MDYKSLNHITLDQTKYSKEELLALNITEENHFSRVIEFLKEWFSESTEITVQTSGSTGKPKQISIPKQSFVESAKNTCTFLDLDSNTNALLCIPVKYIGGKMMVIRALYSGYNLKVVEPSSSPLKELSEKIDFLAITPMQAQNALMDSSEKLESIKQIIIGGGAVSELFIQSIQKFKNTIYSTYGMTETVSHIALKQLNGTNKSSSFQVLPPYSVSVNDENCLVINCPTLSQEKIETNDILKLTDKGFKWLGRKDNVINSGGIKLFPEEIEQKIKVQYPNLVFYITSKKDEVLGEKVILVTNEEVEIDFSKCKLKRYEVPKRVYKKEIEMTGTGKIIRKKY